MKYEYNGNLLEEDRINLVCDEITGKYPFISSDKARQAAMLEGMISTSKTLEIEFNRLYNIMLVISNDINNVKLIYNDLINLLSNNKTHEKFNYFYSVVLEINKFLKGERSFPLLNEF